MIQSHDMLSIVSRDILYTSALAQRAQRSGMAWNGMDSQDQPVRFVVAARRRERPLSALCADFGISRPMRALWIRWYAESLLAGLAERSRLPRSSPAQTPWGQAVACHRVAALSTQTGVLASCKSCCSVRVSSWPHHDLPHFCCATSWCSTRRSVRGRTSPSSGSGS